MDRARFQRRRDKIPRAFRFLKKFAIGSQLILTQILTLTVFRLLDHIRDAFNIYFRFFEILQTDHSVRKIDQGPAIIARASSLCTVPFLKAAIRSL